MTKHLAAIAAAALALTYYLWSPNLGADWGLIDDHEILNMLGPDGAIGFFEIPSYVKTTEAGQFGQHVRYRPGYFLMRPVEGFLWGNYPGRWYLARFVMFAFSAGIAMWLAARLAGLWCGIAFGLWLATGAYWAAIWARLGPAETYATFGTALFCLAFVLIREGLGGPVAPWVALALGTLLSAGAKENFVILAVPAAYLLWRRHREGKLDFPALLAGGFSILLCGLVALSVLLAVSKTGKDIYEKSVSAGSRSQAVFEFFGQNTIMRDSIGAAVVLLLLGLTEPLLRRLYLRMAAAIAVCVTAYLWQLYYYGVKWDAASRYAFPGEILDWIVIFVPAAYLIRELLEPVNRARVQGVLAAVLLLAVWFKGYEPARANAQQNAVFTNRIGRSMQRAAVLAAARPNAVVTLWSTTLEDYETYFSIRSLLRSRGINNPVAVWTAPEGQYRPGGFTPELAQSLLVTMKAITQGSHGFAPLDSREGPAGCIALGVTSAPPASNCQDSGILF